MKKMIILFKYKLPGFAKAINTQLLITLIALFSLSACEQLNELNSSDDFCVLFNDGTKITQNDILYYDSSTKLIYLKKALQVNPEMTDFVVGVSGDSIYPGVIFSCVKSSMPPMPHYILDCTMYRPDILEIGFYGQSDDMRNDSRILEALSNNNLLRNGLSSRIDQVELKVLSDRTQVKCTVTIKNNDQQNYYILDPRKMGELDFIYFTGGLHVQNMETKLSYPLRWSKQSGTWSNVDMSDLLLLETGSEVTFTFQSDDYAAMSPGLYSAYFRFCGTQHCSQQLDIHQRNGHIWVGHIYSEVENLTLINQ